MSVCEKHYIYEMICFCDVFQCTMHIWQTD